MNIPGNVLRYARGGSRRRKAGVPDLNVPLPVENLEQLASVALSVSSGIPVAHDGPGQEPAGSAQPAQPAHPAQPAQPAQPALINLDDFDDDVIISSPQAFEEAKNKSRRIRRTRAAVIDVESEEIRISQAQANKRKRGPSNQPIINCELYVEGSSTSVRDQPRYVAPPPPPPPPPVPELAFNCPICLGPFVDSVTTKCGHIFCKTCIEVSIKAKPSCPTCRRKLTMKNFFRVYLPTAK